MNTLEYIKNRIKELYSSGKIIHVGIKPAHSKIPMQITPALITGVYKNIFQIETDPLGQKKHSTFQYGDVLTGQIVISELDGTESKKPS